MLVIDFFRSLANYVRLNTIYAGIGQIETATYIHSCVTLGSRVNIRLERNVYIGKYCKLSAGIKPASLKIGQRTVIHEFCILKSAEGFIHIGHDCSLNPFSIVLGGGGVKIGNYCRIAPHTVIVAGQHDFRRIDIPIAEQGMVYKGIEIEDDVWIGANCVILDGVTIGKGTIVGAGSVVTKNVEPYSIMGGVPARVISKRVDAIQKVQ